MDALELFSGLIVLADAKFEDKIRCNCKIIICFSQSPLQKSNPIQNASSNPIILEPSSF